MCFSDATCSLARDISCLACGTWFFGINILPFILYKSEWYYRFAEITFAESSQGCSPLPPPRLLAQGPPDGLALASEWLAKTLGNKNPHGILVQARGMTRCSFLLCLSAFFLNFQREIFVYSKNVKVVAPLCNFDF